jgi:DNA-binding LacI/PurR family transcriptional regulator
MHKSSVKNRISTSSADLSDAAVAAIITQRIKHGLYRPGGRVPPERALAAELGVSRRYVRMAYERLTTEGYIEKRHNRSPVVTLPNGFAFRPPEAEAGIAGLKTIAAILPSHPVCPGGLAIIAGIHRVLTDGGSEYRLSVHDTYHANRSEVLRLETKALGTLRDLGDVEGIIWWCYSDDDVIADFLRERPDVSVVFIDRRPYGSRVDFVGIDDIESSRAAVDYLFDIGHRRIAHLMDPGKYSTIVDRADGYRESHFVHGAPVDPDLLIELDWSPDRMERALDHLYGLANPPTAVFTSNDFLAYELIAAAEARGIMTPRDLSVMGHGNIDQFTPRQFLSTVEQPFELIGRTAARLLLRRLACDPTPQDSTQHIILQAPLILRKSCR